MNEVGKRCTLLPTSFFQFRLRAELRHVADTKIRNRRYFRWNSQSRPKRRRIENAHPAHAQRFRARGQPEILHRAHGRINIGRGIRLTPQARAPNALVIAGDAKIHRSFDDGRQLQTVVEFPLLTFVNCRRLLIRPFKILKDFIPNGPVANDNEIPRLHETDRRSMMSGIENARQHIVRHRIREKMGAHVSALVNRSIETALLLG